LWRRLLYAALVGLCSLQATKPRRVEVSLPFTQAQIDLLISPAVDLATSLPRSRVDRGSVKRPAPRQRRLKAIAGEALRYAIKISPKTAIKNTNGDGQKVTSSGA
jgi:hypothetical protein